MKKLAVLLLILFAFAPLQAKINFTDLPDTLQVDLDTKYAVHWSVTFTPVVSQGSATMELLEPMFNAVRLINESENFQLANGSLLYEQSNCTMEQIIKVGEYLYRTSLPSSYRWFCGLQSEDTIVFGIKDTTDTFHANVAEASVHIEPLYGNIPVVGFRLDNGEPTETTQAFQDFTERNLLKVIATEINGEFIMAPTLNNVIEGGAIEATSMPNALINKLFLRSIGPEIIEEAVIIDE
ncbi:hypothetical protein [uncultured Bacteroides sp.]|uniref:hypothetical protein n=1 Tax=uncultured Bacteroides sp. TaxID=162156 RepID=UPI0026029CF8|nr:hypothetical protein [uncultured Bacteroides sp.]